MKADDETVPTNEDVPLAGDVIGDTAYSERFVLKLLLKFANTDTLKEEIQDKALEEDLCTLWDMTAERDVVLFLQKHDALNLFHFALPDIDSPRILEIIIGIIGNMCCQKEVVHLILNMDALLSNLLAYIKSDDSLILIQVLRFINSCLYLTKEEDVAIWVELFEKVDFCTSLYYILKNSSHKDLLVTSLENLNTLFSYCNTEKNRTKFYTQFVTPEAVNAVATALSEIILNLKETCNTEEIERILVVSIELITNFISFDKSPDIYNESKEQITAVIELVLNYYENKLVTEKEIDTDLVDVVDSMNTIINVMKINESCEPCKYFNQVLNIWKTAQNIVNIDQSEPSFEEDDKDELQKFVTMIQPPLCKVMASYIEKCPENHMLKVLDDMTLSEYENILSFVKNEKILQNVSKRTGNYKTRLKDDVCS